MEFDATKLSEILSDPEGLNKIKALADSLFAENKEGKTPKKQPESESIGDFDLGNLDFGGFSLPDGFDITKIMGLMSALSNNQQDERSRLLLALKPHLSTPRQQKVDRAVKLLKLASLIPIVKEQGLFDLI